MDMSQVLKDRDGSYIRKNTVSGKCFHIIGEPVETKNFSSQETQTGVVVHIKVEEEGGRNLLPVFLPHSEGDVCNREVKTKTNQ
jgi:hypothetical protein